MIDSESAVRPARVREVERPTVGGREPLRRSVLDAPAALAVGACVALAVLSVLVLSWVPSSDPWAWIDWGRAIASSKISFGLAGGPSWKPFPVVFTTVFGFFGGAAPHLWLVVGRAAGLLALVAAYRLGRRFGGSLAGVLAAIALFLTQDWLFYIARGASEPVVAALTLWAIDRHLAGSPRLAYFLGFLAALNRPEFSVFLVVYALYLWLRVPKSRILVVSLLVLVAFAWLVPPWVLSGDPFQAGHAALGGKGSPGTGLAELRSGFTLMTVPVVVLAAIALALAHERGEKTLVVLGAGAIAWALMVAVITQVAYGLPRYLLPGAMIADVMAGVAVVWIAKVAAARFAGGSAGRLVLPAAAALVLALTLPWTVSRVHLIVRQVHQADQAVLFQKRLFLAVDRVGGVRTVLPCRSSVVAVNHSLASALAWKLQVQLRRVSPLMRGTGYVFRAPRNTDTGTTPPIADRAAKTVRTVALVRPWRVLEVTRRGASSTPHCAAGDVSRVTN
jgi:hypothetical protein